MRATITVLLLLVFTAFSFATASELEVEPGTGYATAPELSPGTYKWYIDAGQRHYFKIWLNAGQTLYIIMRVPILQDMDIFLVSPEREYLEGSTAPAGISERISFQAPYSGYYYIIVSSYFGSRGLYTLTLRVIDLPTKTVTVTETETVLSYETIIKPSITISTVTKTIYETETSLSVIEVERVPWTFIGAAIIAVSIVLGLGLIARAISSKAG